jgi:transposase
MARTTGGSHAGGHNLMNAGAPDLPIEPRRRESSEEHQARMDKKRAAARRFEQLDRAAAAPSTKSVTLDRAPAIEAYKAGEGIVSIAKRFHIGPATLKAWLKEAGVPLRDLAAAREIRKSSNSAPAAKSSPRPAPPARATTRTPTREEQDRLAAVNAYVQGDAVDEIAKRLGRGLSTVYAWLDAAGVPRRGRPTPPELDPAALAADYRSGLGVVALAGKYSTAPRRITAALLEAGVDVSARGAQRTAASDAAPTLPLAAPSAPAPLSTPAPAEPTEQPAHPPAEQPAARARNVDAGERDAIVASYAAGQTAVEIAARHGRSPKTIRDTLRGAGVQLRDDRATRSGGQPKEYDPALVAEVRRLYVDERLTQAEVAARTGSTAKVVQRLMDRHEIPTRPDATGRTVEARPAPVREQRPLADAAARLAAATPTTTSRAYLERDPADAELVRLREALATQRPSQIADQPEAIAAVAQAVEDVIGATRTLADRWNDLQLARDLDAGGAFARIRVSAEQVLALTTRPDTERTAS